MNGQHWALNHLITAVIACGEDISAASINLAHDPHPDKCEVLLFRIRSLLFQIYELQRVIEIGLTVELEPANELHEACWH